MAGDNHQPKHGFDKTIANPVHGPADGAFKMGGTKTLADQFREALELSREAPDPVVYAEASARLKGTSEAPDGPHAKWREAAEAQAQAKRARDKRK